MAFVHEPIEESDKNSGHWQKFKAWPACKRLNPSRWTIDRDRDVFLVALKEPGVNAEHPAAYALYWKGHVIFFDMAVYSHGSAVAGFDHFLRISNIEFPLHLQILQRKILIVLKEAIEAHESLYARDHVKSVYVEIV